MWPINGTYASWQRELYGYIVEYHKVVLSRIRPGVTPDQVMDEAAEEMKGTGFIASGAGYYLNGRHIWRKA